MPGLAGVMLPCILRTDARPDGKVFSYEFVPDNLDILRRNLALNPELSDRIQVIESAAWGESDLAIAVQGEGPGSHVSVGGAGCA